MGQSKVLFEEEFQHKSLRTPGRDGQKGKPTLPTSRQGAPGVQGEDCHGVLSRTSVVGSRTLASPVELEKALDKRFEHFLVGALSVVVTEIV